MFRFGKGFFYSIYGIVVVFLRVWVFVRGMLISKFLGFILWIVKMRKRVRGNFGWMCLEMCNM